MDVFADGRFPLCPATHDLGLRRLFDLSTLLLLLDCRPGDRVLDLGAGPGFSSEMLARLGYDVIAIDPDHASLQANRRRPSWDPQRIDGTIRVVQGIAERLPIAAASVDGILGMNVLHHLEDLPGATEELARVLRPGGRAVFAEPGLDHLQQEETRRAIREHGEDDRAFDVLRFLTTARGSGFREAMLTATLQSPLRLLPIEEVELYRSGQHPRPHMTPAGVLDELHRRHPYAMLTRDGTRLKTSRYPGVLSCTLDIDGVPAQARAGERIATTAHVTNTGDTIWEVVPSPRGGFVTIGCKLATPDGRLVSDTLGRTFLPHAVAPGASVSTPMAIELPRDLAPGNYVLSFDLVDELICWFAAVSGQAPAPHPIAVRA